MFNPLKAYLLKRFYLYIWHKKKKAKEIKQYWDIMDKKKKAKEIKFYLYLALRSNYMFK